MHVKARSIRSIIAAKMIDILFELDIRCAFEYQTVLTDLHPFFF
jgi:hypothetical protein